MKELLLIAGGVWLGNFLAGVLDAERKGLAFRAWLKRRFKPPQV